MPDILDVSIKTTMTLVIFYRHLYLAYHPPDASMTLARLQIERDNTPLNHFN